MQFNGTKSRGASAVTWCRSYVFLLGISESRMPLSGYGWKFVLRHLTRFDIVVHDSKIQCSQACSVLRN